MSFHIRSVIGKLAVAALLVGGVVGLAAPAAVYATCSDTTKLDIQTGAACATPQGTNTILFGQNGIFELAINTILFFIGLIAVVYLILGGIHYVTSGGDQAAIAKAKNTILYAIIGIIVAFLAFALVNFIISQFKGTGGGSAQGAVSLVVDRA